MSKDWYDFQEKICEHFKTLGFNSCTNKTIQGARTSHDVDVYSEIIIAGQKNIWIIEAKYWKNKISKLHVLGLRTIVDDIGANNGIIISTRGFQKGAIEATWNTNIRLLTFEDFIADTINHSQIYQLEFIKERIRFLYIKNFSHSKKIRIKYQMRGNIFDNEMPTPQLMLYVMYAAIMYAENNDFPIYIHNNYVGIRGASKLQNSACLINWLNENLNFLDNLFLDAEIHMLENHEYHPNYGRDYVTHEWLKEWSKNFSKLFITTESQHIDGLF